MNIKYISDSGDCTCINVCTSMNLRPTIFVKSFHNNGLDLLYFTAHSESESEASYASVPRRESTDSGNSNDRYR